MQPPPPTASNSKTKTYLLFAGIIAIALAIVLGVYFLSQKGQQYKTPAAVPACHNGTPPLNFDPDCLEDPLDQGSDQKSCTAPSEGFCKRKGSCFECRFSNEGLRVICPCVSPTATPVALKQPVCEKPNMCLPKDQCIPSSITTSPVNTGGGGPISTINTCAEGLICCMPGLVTPSTVQKLLPTPTLPAGVTPTGTTPTLTPTTPPVGGSQASPTPTITPGPTSVASTSAPTSAPTLPAAGVQTGMYLLLGFGAVLLLLGLAL